jgi:hypothetical protein
VRRLPQEMARRGQSPSCHRQTRRVRALKVALKADLVAAAVSASDLSLMLTGASMGLRSLLSPRDADHVDHALPRLGFGRRREADVEAADTGRSKRGASLCMKINKYRIFITKL